MTLPAGADRLAAATTSVFVPPGGHGDGAPLFLLPGFGLDGRSFAALAPLAEGRRVIFWSPPNDLPHGENLDAVVRLVLEHADLAGCRGRFVLGGASLGGILALHAALAFPERVAGLVLLGTTAAWKEVSRPVRLAAFLHRFVPRRSYPRILPRILIPLRHDPPGGSAVNDALRTQMAHRTRAFGRRLVLAMRRRGGFDLRPRLAQIPVPTLVIHGGRDHATPPRAARTLARIPSSRVVVLDSAGHVPFVSHGRACVEALEPFLVEVDAHEGGRRSE